MSSSLRELTPDQFARISQLLDESLELAPQERHTWLGELERRDPEAALLLRRLFAAQETGEAARFVNKLGEIATALAPAISAEAPLIDRRFGPYRIRLMPGWENGPIIGPDNEVPGSARPLLIFQGLDP